MLVWSKAEARSTGLDPAKDALGVQVVEWVLGGVRSEWQSSAFQAAVASPAAFVAHYTSLHSDAAGHVEVCRRRSSSHSVHCHCCHSRAATHLCLVVACNSSPSNIHQACITLAQHSKSPSLSVSLHMLPLAWHACHRHNLCGQRCHGVLVVASCVSF